jgi:hypothetical protein
MHRLIALVLTAAFVVLFPVQAMAAKADVAGALAYVPKDAISVVTADLEAVKQSKLFAFGKAAFLSEEKSAKKKIAELKKATGFDVWRDVHAAVVTFGPEFAKDDDQFAIIAHTTISEKKVVAFAKKKGGKLELKQGPSGPFYLLGKRKEGAIAFRGNIVILAGAKFMPKVLKKQGMGAKLKGLISKYKSRNIAAAVNVTPALAKQLKREDKALGEVTSAAAGLDIRSGAALNAEAKFKNAKTPKKIANMANQGLAELKADKSVKKMGIGSMLHKVKLSAVGPTLKGSIKLSQSDLNKLEKLLKNFL